MKDISHSNAEYFYAAFRVIIGVLFLLHGIAKVPGIMDGTTKIISLFALAALIEIVGGVFLIVGLFAKTTAAITAIEMLVAYFMFHFPNEWNPLKNEGEPALLFFAAFLVIIAYGAG
ncbi:MAG: DoxX family protein, partial [Nanoarchaeota archaeon]